ncbi:MAG TPA: lipid-A-disaccharide synthase [Bryobacteraceae bacterium]|nr:lipid-A-disaccharide synthase [Bryobacteraceae bacterium]
MAPKVLISAGEASGDLYASSLVLALRRRHPDMDFFGCTGPRLRHAGVRQIVDSASLGVVGLVEVITHLPRIRREFHKLLDAAKRERPDAAILTDSAGFHLRVARRLHAMGIPVIYLVAPQVWAWRQWRLPLMRRVLTRLLCIFPFEQGFFQKHGVPATYIGHPLSRLVRASAGRAELRRIWGVPEDRFLIAVLPGSREGEIERHRPYLEDAISRIQAALPGKCQFILALPPAAKMKERFSGSSIQVKEGQTWDILASADVALAASGTVTVEACLLGTPMVTFYRVNRLTWMLGRSLVRVPFFSMVNLIAGRKVVSELIQDEMTGERLAAEVIALLNDAPRRAAMRGDLAEVSALLATKEDPMEKAAVVVEELLSEDWSQEMVHV